MSHFQPLFHPLMSVSNSWPFFFCILFWHHWKWSHIYWHTFLQSSRLNTTQIGFLPTFSLIWQHDKVTAPQILWDWSTHVHRRLLAGKPQDEAPLIRQNNIWNEKWGGGGGDIWQVEIQLTTWLTTKGQKWASIHLIIFFPAYPNESCRCARSDANSNFYIFSRK